MVKLESAAATDPGRKRKNNQDRVWAQVNQPTKGEPVGLFIVCDGVGGYQGGELASQWTVDAVRANLNDLLNSENPRQTVLDGYEAVNTNQFENEITRVSDIRKLEERVVQAILNANVAVCEFAKEKPEIAGDAATTITLAAILGNIAVIANVGDSRTYLLREGQLRQITQDHSLVWTLVANGKIRKEEVYSHPQRNVIFRSLGQKIEVQVDTFIEHLTSGDLLLLCSDGLWEMLPDDQQIVQLLQGAVDVQEACFQLVDAANQAGGDDNISVVVVSIL